MNDILRDNISRSRLRAEDCGDGTCRNLTCLNLLILPNDPQKVQLLAFVLMQTFGLYVKYSAVVNLRSLVQFDPFAECRLVVFF